jgi:hypothetical protein
MLQERLAEQTESIQRIALTVPNESADLSSNQRNSGAGPSMIEEELRRELGNHLHDRCPPNPILSPFKAHSNPILTPF